MSHLLITLIIMDLFNETELGLPCGIPACRGIRGDESEGEFRW